MPHFLISRARSGLKSLSAYLYDVKEAVSKDATLYSYSIEFLEVMAAVLFVIGSFCFIPKYSKNVEVFQMGCNLFVVGSVQYLIICSLTLLEAWEEKGKWTFEVAENLLYLIGSVVFLVGTVLYFPERDHCEHVASSEDPEVCASIGQEVNKSTKEWYGTVLFIMGSLIFTVAVFLNALNQRKFIEWQHQMVTVITMLYMLGSVLFCMGSVAFLPDVGCGPEMVEIGANMFIVGSIFFLIASLLSFWRTSYMLRHPEEVEELPITSGEVRSEALDKDAKSWQS